MNVAVYCGSTPGVAKVYCDTAAALAKAIAEKHTIVYGGSNTGLMGIIADSALAAGGKVIGVQPDVPLIRARRHPGLTEYIDTPTMAERRTQMIRLSDAFIALPGGPGTLDEISEVLTLLRLRIIDKPCVFYNVNGYYDPLAAQLDAMLQNGFAENGDFDRVLFSSDDKEILRFLEK